VKYRRNTGAVVGLLISGLLLAACGSSSKSSSSTTSAASKTTSTAVVVKGPAFRLGAVCSCSGVQAATLARMAEISNVWAKAVNAAGGINGHPVTVTALDDGGNPTTALKNVKQLVEQNHIQALVSDGSLADQSFVAYLTQKGIPVIGGTAVSTPFLTSTNFFASGANLPIDTVGLGALAKGAGKQTLGVLYCTETPLCAQAVPIAKGAAALTGLKFASGGISSTAPSYAAPCLAMKSKGVDALFVADNGATLQRVAAGCAQQGYKPTFVINMSSLLPTFLNDANLQGALIASSNASQTDTSNPGVAAFRAAVKKYDPSLLSSPQFDINTLYVWAAGRLFEAAAAAGHLTPSSTPAQVKAAVYKTSGTTLGGLSAPLPIKQGQPVITPCYYGLTIKNNALTTLSGGKPLCLTAAQVGALLTGLKKLLG
jgi:branched-chain amino acid transport system substrate-binding protein